MSNFRMTKITCGEKHLPHAFHLNSLSKITPKRALTFLCFLKKKQTDRGVYLSGEVPPPSPPWNPYFLVFSKEEMNQPRALPH
ncbi:unnamed protein product [Prunus armeniaca]